MINTQRNGQSFLEGIDLSRIDTLNDLIPYLLREASEISLQPRAHYLRAASAELGQERAILHRFIAGPYDEDVKVAAVKVLGCVGGEVDALFLVSECKKQPPSSVQNTIIQGLMAIGGPIAANYLEDLHDELHSAWEQADTGFVYVQLGDQLDDVHVALEAIFSGEEYVSGDYFAGNFSRDRVTEDAMNQVKRDIHDEMAWTRLRLYVEVIVELRHLDSMCPLIVAAEVEARLKLRHSPRYRPY